MEDFVILGNNLPVEYRDNPAMIEPSITCNGDDCGFDDMSADTSTFVSMTAKKATCPTLTT